MHPSIRRFRAIRPVSRILAVAVAILGAAAPISAAEVVLDVLAADARIDGRDVASVFGDPQDFFPVTSVVGVPGPSRDIRSNRDHAAWPDHQVRATVDPSLRFYNVTVRLDEADDFGDETFDIHPAAGLVEYSFTFDACTLTYEDTDLIPFVSHRLKGEEWLPYGNGDIGGNPDKDARVKIKISTGDGKPFTSDDLALAEATPVQGPYFPRQIVEKKPTAFKVRIESTFAGVVKATVSVTLNDGVAPRTEMETFDVPPEGLTAFLFEDAPYIPEKNLADPVLRYSVTMTVEDETYDPDACESQNNEWFGKSLPVRQTRDKVTVYRPFDAPADGEPADILSVAELQALYDTAEPFRLAIFPLERLDSSIDPTPIVASSGFPFDNVGAQLARLSLAAGTAGIEKMIAVPRRDSLENIGLFSPGVAVPLVAPRAVFVEHDTSTTASHELSHTFDLSRRNCTDGGLLEEWFAGGCLDEYEHPQPPAPYLASGFDVGGAIHPTGLNGVPGTRDVFGFNLMDQRDGNPYDGRWIDSYTFDLLADAYAVQGDPPLIGVWGWVEMPGGLQDPPQPFNGDLFFAYRFDGIPDLPEAAIGGGSGAGRFEIRLLTQQGAATYRFNPGYAADVTADGTERGFFALAVPWPVQDFVTGIELWGPSDIADPAGPADRFLASIARTSSEPDVTSMRAGLDLRPSFAGPQPEPPTIGPSHDVVIAWQATDPDSPALRTTLHLDPPDVPGQYNAWLPMAIELEGDEFTIPHEWLQNKPGMYIGRVLVSDGINTKPFEQGNLFLVCNFANGGVEICDGVDDDCNGVVDDAVAPGPGIAIDLTPLEVSWPPFAAAETYDVIAGDLLALRASGGDFSQATTGCLGDDVAGTSVPFPDVPPPGQGFWVLARATNCAGAGTYDTSGIGQVGARDGGIGNSQAACP